MERERVLRTYGHHRKRCVISTDSGDLFNSTNHCRHNVFSTSSSESGLGPSDSIDSGDSIAFSGRTAKTKAMLQLKSERDGKGKNKRRKKQMEMKKTLFVTDQDTSLSPAHKRTTRQALHEVNGNCEQKAKKRQPVRKIQRKMKPGLPEKDHSSINFSEFDDYSLIISDSPIATRVKENKRSVETRVTLGTSTPCNASSARLRPSPDIQTADISFIATCSECGELEENPEKPSSTSLSASLCGHQEYDSSLLDSSVQLTDDVLSQKDETCDKRNLERLEESFVSSRVGQRRLKKQKEMILQMPQSESESESAIDIGVSHKNSQCTELSPDQDHILHECRVRMQKLTESLLKKAAEMQNLSEATVFDGSTSLFESSVDVELRTPVSKMSVHSSAGIDGGRNENVLAVSESEHSFLDLGSENLSAIVEDGEEEHQENGESKDLDDSVDIELEANGSCSMLSEPDTPKDVDDPVRYMLASLSCQDEGEEAPMTGEDEESMSLDASILSGKGSVGGNHSFAEMLTPSKCVAESGEELSPLQKILEQCGQEEPLPFTKIIPTSILKKCVKIGEGVYGEVFRAKRGGQSVALKIVPVEGDFEVNDEKQKTFLEILPEIVISNELSKLREEEENHTSNFCPLKSVSLVKGCYPSQLIKEWELYEQKKVSENDHPGVFKDDQLYIMFEFGDGGSDLDRFKFKSAAQAVSVLQQVACALAVAEQALSFEHRDLHTGNILVQTTSSATETVILNNKPIFIDTQGIHVNIIDFTFSRLTKDGCTVFCDVSTDESLFEGKGDYQFEIYRMMKRENRNKWAPYHPYTNVMWLHYVCDKLIHHKNFQETDRSHRESLKHLRQAFSSLLEYSSATHFVQDDSLFMS